MKDAEAYGRAMSRLDRLIGEKKLVNQKTEIETRTLQNEDKKPQIPLVYITEYPDGKPIPLTEGEDGTTFKLYCVVEIMENGIIPPYQLMEVGSNKRAVSNTYYMLKDTYPNRKFRWFTMDVPSDYYSSHAVVGRPMARLKPNI